MADKKMLLTEEKHREWYTMIEELTNMLAMIPDALQMIDSEQQELIYKMEVMAAIILASTVVDLIVNYFNHCLDEHEARIAATRVKLPVPLLPPMLHAVNQSSAEM
jgi:hypothetical protein